MDWARCEISAEGLLDQPIDLVTGLVGVIAGIWLVRRNHPLVGGALVLSGFASAGYHARAGSFTGWLDAVGVALVALAFVADAARWPRAGVVLAAILTAGLVLPEALRASVTAIVVVAAVALVLTRERLDRDRLGMSVALFGGGLVAWWIASDPSRCTADGWLPLHAAWHLAAFAAVTVIGTARRPRT